MGRLLRLFFCASLLTCLAAEQKSLKVHIATWNVNSQHPPQNMMTLLGQENGDQPDIVVLGLQEVTMNPKQAIVDYLFHDKWTSKADIVLGNDYSRVKAKVLVSVVMVVYVKHEYAKQLKDVDSYSVKTGLGGFYGNKGGVVLSFRLLGNRFNFVNSHLPAHDGAIESRIVDYKIIEARRAHESWSKQDYLFWMGDLNFRIADDSLDGETISKMVEDGRLKEVLAKDELKQLMADGTIFKKWNEAEINFKPTFKVVVGKGTYNLKRRPAWTDRILYKSDTGKEIVNTAYTSVDGFYESDHKPVIADFELAMGA